MKYTEVLEKRAFLNGAKKWVVDKYNQIADKTNQHVQSRYVEPQARAASTAATDAAITQAFKTIGSYAVPTLVGAGTVGLLTHGISERINKRRKKDESKLPTGLLTTLGTIGGGIGSAYLWDRFGKHASLNYSNVAAMLKQADAYDWYKRPNQASDYAVFAKRGPKDPTIQQETEVFRKAWNNPGVGYMWDDDSRQYLQVPPAKKTPTQPTSTVPTAQKTNFTAPKPVTPVQPPQYRQADTTVKDVEGFR